MAGLYDAARLAVNPNSGGALFDAAMAARGEPLPPDEQTLLEAQYTPTITRGLRAGMRGLASGVTGFGASALEAAGSPAATDWYAAAQEQARQAALEGPEIARWADVRDPSTFAEYMIGKAGEMAPMIVPSVAGAGLANAARLGPAGVMAGGMAPLHPTMAGGVALRMHEDPVTAELDAKRRFAIANLEGAAQAGLYAAIPSVMTGRAVGRPALAAPPRGPLGTAGGVVADTALSTTGMGAAGAAAGQLGREVQRALNPEYQIPGGDEEAMKEEFAAGAAGMLPVAVPHAVVGRTLGATLKPGQDIAARGVELAKQGAGKLADVTLPSAEMPSEFAQGVKRAYTDANIKADIAGGKPIDQVLAGIEASVQHAAETATENVVVGARSMYDRASKLADGGQALAKELAVKLKRTPSPDELGAALDANAADAAKSIGAYIKRHTELPVDPELAALLEKAGSGAQLSIGEAQRLGQLGVKIAKLEPLIAESKEAPATGKESRGTDVFQGTARAELKRLGVSDAEVNNIAGRLHANVIERFGATKSVRDALDAAGYPPEVRTAIEKPLVDAMRALMKERMPDVHELGTQHLYDEFSADAGNVVDTLFFDQKLTPQERELATKGLVTMFNNVASGQPGYANRMPQFARYITEAFGDAGHDALTALVEKTKLRFGADSKQAQRVANIIKDHQGEVSKAAELRELLKPGVLEKYGSAKGPASVMPLIDQMRRTLEKYEADATRNSERVRKLRIAADQYRSLGAEGEARKMEYHAADVSKAEYQRDVVERLKQEWSDIVKPGDFERARAIVARYSREPRLTKAETKSVHDTAAGKLGEREPEGQEAQIAAVEEGLRKGEEEQFAATRQEEHFGTQGEEAVPQYHGMDAFTDEPVKGTPAPLDFHPSPDFPGERGMGAAAAERLGYGYRLTDLSRMKMHEWADEMSARSGRTADEHLNDAMNALLAADKQRTKKLASITEKSTAETLKFIKARADMAERLVKRHGNEAGRFFFEDPMNRNFGYYRAEQSGAENLAYTAKDLERFGPQKGENVKGYAARRANEGEFPRAAYEGSILPVKLESGSTREVDVSQMMDAALARHQAGDITGVGKKEAAAPAADQRISPRQQHTPQELLTAFHNIVAAIIDAKGVDAANAFGQKTAAGKLFATPRGDFYFDPSLVVYRDPVNGRVWTLGQITGKERVEAGRPMAENQRVIAGKTVTKNITDADVPKFAKPTKGSVTVLDADAAAKRGVMAGALEKDGVRYDLNLKELLKHVVEKKGMDPIEVMADTDLPQQWVKERLREGLRELETMGYKLDVGSGEMAKAREGTVVLRTDYGTKASPVTREMIIEEYERQRFMRHLRETERNPEYVAQSFQGRKRLEQRIVTSKFKPEEKPTAARDLEAQIRSRMVEKPNIGETTYGQLRLTESADRLPHTLEEAKIAAAREELGKLEATKGQWDKNLKEGVKTLEQAADMAGDYPISERIADVFKKLGFLSKEFDPGDFTARTNRWRVEDTDNSRIAQILRELGNNDAPVFDKATQNLFSEAAGLLDLNKTKYSDVQKRTLHDAEDRVLAIARESLKHAEEQRKFSQPQLIEREPVGVPAKLPAAPEGTEYVAPPRVVKEAPAPAEKRPVLGLPKKPEVKGDWSGVNEKGEAVKVPFSEQRRLVKAEEATPEAVKPAQFDATTINKEMAANEKPGIADASKRIQTLTDAQLRELALKIPASKRSAAQEQFANVLKGQFKTRMEAAGLEWTGSVFKEKGGEAFSMGKTKEGGWTKEAVDAEVTKATEDFRRAVGQLAGLAFEEGKVGPKKEAIGHTEFSDKAKGLLAQVAVSTLADDIVGTTRHESWHVVRDLLKEMGAEGKRVADTISRYVDTPMMKAWLERQFADNPGALEQIRSDSLEREAYAYQAFRQGAQMPMHPEGRGVFRTLVDWLKAKFGFSTDKEKTAAFFKYVADGEFVRDHENPLAVLRGLGETKSDKFAKVMTEISVPFREGIDKVIGHTGQRIDDMGNEHYTAVRKMFEGEHGKAGYNMWVRAGLVKFDNAFTEAFKDVAKEDRAKITTTPAFQKLVNDVVAYAHQVMTDAEVRNVMRDTFAADQKLASENMQELITDLSKHGGLQGQSAGTIRDIAAQLADQGYAPGVKIFADSPEMRAKWQSRDPADQAGRAIETIVRRVEREKAFGKNDEKLKAALEAGDALATPDEQAFMNKAVKAYEHKLGHDELSPQTKKLMSALIVANNMRLLPLAVMSQFLEPLQLAFRKNDMSVALDSLWKGIADLPRSFETIDKHYTPGYWENLGKQVGSVGSLGSMLSDMHTGFHMPGKIGKLNDLFFRYTGQEAWNRRMNIEATKHAVEFLREHTGQSEHYKPGQHSERFLKELGLEKSDVQFNKAGELVLNDKVERAIVQFVHESMAYPDPGSNPLWMNDARFALLSQMKRFQFAHARYVLDRGVREWNLGNKAVLYPILPAVATMMVSDALRDVITGGQPAYKNNWGVGDRLLSGFERSGMFGRAQFLDDALSSVKHGGTGIEGALGPTYELFGRMARGANSGKFLDSLFGEVPGAPLIMPD